MNDKLTSSTVPITKSAESLYSSLELLAIILMPLSLILLSQRSSWVFFCNIQLICLISILIFSFLRTRSILLYHMWILGYVFIVWSEMFIVARNPLRDNAYLEPFILFTVSNTIVLFSYVVHQARWKLKKKYLMTTLRQKQLFLGIIVVWSMFIIIVMAPNTISTFLYGRSHASGYAISTNVFTGGLISSSALVLPAIVAYYYRCFSTRPWRSLWLAIPIIAITLFGATRFRMLYAVIGYLFVMISPKNVRIKNVIFIILGIFVLASWSSYMKKNRMLSAENKDTFQLFESNLSDSRKSLADYMSPEGVVSMAVYADKYFSENPLRWGRESAFLLYFWIPRRWWPNKPTQLSYWLIREFETVASNHSTASGYIGELRADFGWGALLFMFLFGLLLKEGDYYVAQIYSARPTSYSIIVVTLLYPTVFFIIRSPQTAIPTFIGVYVVLFIIRKIVKIGYRRI